MKYITLIIFIAFVASCSKDNEDDIIPPPEENTPSTLPQKELRGVWVTTAWGIDWPMEEYNATAQKQKYIDYLNLLVENKMNAIFFQIREWQMHFMIRNTSLGVSISQELPGLSQVMTYWDFLLKKLINEISNSMPG